MSKIPHQSPAKGSLEALLVRYRDHGDPAALTELFDTAAPGLRRLARRLAGPRRHDLADDALQETFLALVERPDRFDESRRLLPWLATVLVNRLRRLQERESRSLDEARLLERGVESPEDAALYRDLAAHVESEVEKLPPTVREAVSGKVLRGEEIDALSHELGISPGAFRVRLHRGLNKLRAALPKSLLGALGVLGLRDKSYAAMRARVLQAGGAPIGASAWGLWIGVILAILVTGGMMWRLSAPDVSNRELAANRSEEELEKSAGNSTPVLLTETETARAERVDRQAVSERQGRLRVEVLDRNSNEQLSGVAVQLRYVPFSAADTLHAVTDENGRAEFSVEAGRRMGDLRVECAGAHAAASLNVRGVFQPGEVREETLRLGSGGSISGRVVDLEGSVVPAARVMAWCNGDGRGEPARTVTADAAGRFTLEHLGPDFVLRARTDELVSAEGLHGEIQEEAAHEGLQLVVAPQVTLRGRVVDEKGNAVLGAAVELSAYLGSYSDWEATDVPGIFTFKDARGEAVSDIEGEFVIEGLPQESRPVSLQHAEFEPVTARTSAPFDEEQTIVMQRALRVTGQVFDSEGEPAAGARLRGWPRTGAAVKEQSWVEADDNGRFTMTGFQSRQPGIQAEPGLAVLHEGHAVQVVDSVQPSASGSKKVVVRLRELGRTLTGRVVDASGNALSRIDLLVIGRRTCNTGVTWGQSRPSTWEYISGIAEAETNERGEFSFDQLYPGEFEIRAFDPADSRVWASKVVESGSAEIEISLAGDKLQKVVLEGTVRSAHSGEPITAFSIHPMLEGEDGNSMGSTHTIVDADGKFRVAGLDPGRYRIAARAPGYAQERKPSLFLKEGTSRFDFELREVRDLRVSVEVEKNSLENFRVTAQGLRGQTIMFDKGRHSGSHTALRDGKVVLSGLPAEPILLTVASAHRSQEIEVDLTLPREDPVVVRFDALQVHAARYFLLEATVDVSEEELREIIRQGRTEEAVAWWEAHREKVGPPLGDFTVEFTTEEGVLVSKGRFKSQGDGSFEVNSANYFPTTTEMSIPGGVAPACNFKSPSTQLRVKVESEYYEDQEMAFTVEAPSPEEDAERALGTLILLRRP